MDKMDTAIAELGTGIYTSYDASKILKIPPRKAWYWFSYYVKYRLFESIGYQYHFDTKDTTAVDFLTLIEMYIFYILKDNINMSSRNIVRYHKILSDELDTPHPFACSNLYAAKASLIFEKQNRLTKADDIQQTFIEDFVLPFYHKISFGGDDIASKYHPLGKDRSVVVDPKHQFGRPTIEGTNIRTETLSDLYLGGDNIDFIARLYKITESSVKDAIEFSKAA